MFAMLTSPWLGRQVPNLLRARTHLRNKFNPKWLYLRDLRLSQGCCWRVVCSGVLCHVICCTLTDISKALQSWKGLFTIRRGITPLKTLSFRVDALFYVFRSLCMFLCINYSWSFTLCPHQSRGKRLRFQWVRWLDGPWIGFGHCEEEIGLRLFQRSIPFIIPVWFYNWELPKYIYQYT